jgi:hypothetical protein
VGGGVQLGSLGTAATDWPIVPAPGDYDDGEFGGMKIGRGNRSTRGNAPQRHFVHHKPLGLATIFYCLRFETSLFVSSYDSQGNGGGIRPRLHTGSTLFQLA